MTSFDSAYVVFLFSVALILITPGPTNTLLAIAGLGLGLRRALHLLAFEFSGYFLSISAWGLLLAPLQSQHPWMSPVVKIASSCYLAYTAVKVWRDARLLQTPQQRAITPRMLFIATLLNPKALLFALVLFPAHSFESAPAYALAMASFTCLLVPIGALWIAVGQLLGARRRAILAPGNIQRASSVALAMFSAFIFWGAWR
ncbi:LysE family transporter [Herbaspirillum sp. LeCh32-8]|uniref:LysE family translocator n=1 Tax=Herbaspirillum sp. LeCh32-8 TaxID=2821356 RepID=UPI001AE3FA6A|nr:LysE family transporter [Herbaspirillum sp. LeCh32-8]MBP0598220.1 LysE family transporter [Herbaspirillum sp. LeCh32-8]